MAVPIWIGGRMEGILYVANWAPQPFTDHDEAILQRLADQAAIAMQNARLYQQQAERQAEVRTLLEINKTLGQVHALPSLLDAIAEEAARLLDVPLVTFRLREGKELPMVGAWAQAGTEIRRSTLQVGQSLGGWVVATGETLVINDVTQDDRARPEARVRMARLGYVAFLGVPLRLGDMETGYRVLSAGSGAEALQRCEQHTGAIDLVLTDVVMPGMSGRDLAGQVMHRWPRVKILYMSGYTDEMLSRHGALDPSISFLEKPFSPEILTRKVCEVLPLDRP